MWNPPDIEIDLGKYQPLVLEKCPDYTKILGKLAYSLGLVGMDRNSTTRGPRRFGKRPKWSLRRDESN